MKRIILMLVTLSLLMTSWASASDLTSETIPKQANYVPAILEVLKDELLVPDSLSIRKIEWITLRLKRTDGSISDNYHFFLISYIAQNRMGGYSDNFLYALSTYDVQTPEVALLSPNGDIKHGSQIMLSDLTDLWIRSSMKMLVSTCDIFSWGTLPNECELY